ncbi:hypothetical protein MPTK1_3g19940 [Marchantia polymorpha subsp. ruderalis]|uniref:Protein kinase domain-containing protein n=2 Tax=Marchantia polymorpha TaxID=3197 RepID=A0AAF6B2R2_MARPO|nr:hypothetical protein MARPO_0049s0040 [Marchantia polymorpha]PTQ38747.1 hypothetical protein MARPO_0049s0040 [Marchantia polymorpha]BBN06295.1 hypothetical protein Mp_3g19940 [Marchantia polymorpha subsp. ruderalis]BBN06296.1 hypothetical protein Mp_3g19940 [Marchantia polymorpha subsp. ruderalis]|eukprot:PTQ38746.1 hypothetical protein MARPO_0049s0040 [Marchantia polymorpha]
MADSVNAILEYLRKHNFSEAENALRSELTARQTVNGPLPLPLEDDADLNVNVFHKAMQERDAQHQGIICPEPEFILASPERSKGAQAGFNFIHSKPEPLDGIGFRESSQQLFEEKAVFVDSGIEKLSSPTSPRSPRHEKFGAQLPAGSALEKVNPSGDVLGLQTGLHGSDFSRGPQYKKATAVTKQPKKHLEEASVRREGATSIFGEQVFHNDAPRSGEDLSLHVVTSDVIRPVPRKLEDVSFEEVRLVEAHQMHEDAVEQIGSPQWIGTLQQDRQGVPPPVVVVAPKTIKPSTKRPSSDQDKRDVLNEVPDNGVQHENGGHHLEKPMLVRDLIANERASKGQSSVEDAEKAHHGRSGGGSHASNLKEKGIVENGGVSRDSTSITPWKDVPIKTSFPFSPPESSSTCELPIVETFVVEGVKCPPREEKPPQEKTRAVEVSNNVHSGRGSRERSRSADGALKVLEGTSRSFPDVQEELPRLPPVRLRSGDTKPTDSGGANSRPSADSGLFVNIGGSAEAAFGLGSFLDIPVGQDVSSSGARRLSGGSRPSVSQGIVEDASERLSGFATVGDGQSESLVEYPDEYWDSDTYDDDDDPGYHRQPIEDEEWFLAHEIDYPDERSSPGLESSRSHHDKDFARSTDGYGSGELKEGDDDEEVEMNNINKEEADAVAADDEEAAAVQEQIRRIRAEEEEFETFNLKIVHRKNRTGFEENKDFPVVINSVIAGRYHVTEYLGSAAFSKAIQAHDLHTGMDVCMKIIKNNKDFFDQSLDEIKLLKYINKHDPGDKYHVLRLYDYFYHREHLFIVCELLRANLYEFHKYNRESGGEVYFTMPRLQSITRQCLEALEFIHGLGLIHCDLKPENILVKSYSRCEVKVIDLGSSCFQTDHLCSYVQSRSYRAPEVILGLPYNQKIDMWSLGCILAELCSGNVLFQNDSLATLLARVVGILGPIDPEMLSKGRDTHKFFTKNHMLYERNQDTDQLEYLRPKKTSLSHRLPMGDQGFVEFVGYLLHINPASRPTAGEALKHPWLSYPYEPISA